MLRLTCATRRLLAKLTLEGKLGRAPQAAETSLSATGPAVRPEAASGARVMRRAIARAGLARMTAEGDRLSLLVTAIGITAVASIELDQRDQTRPDTDAAQFDRLGRLQRRLRRQVQGR